MDNLEIRNLSVEDTLQYEQLACIAFHSKSAGLADPQARLAQIAEAEERNLQNRTRQGNCRVRTGLFRDGKLLSALTAHAFAVNFDGQSCEMCGIGGVMSDPSARKTGGVSRILRQEFAAMRVKGQIFSHLYPFQTSFYRKFGYAHCAFAVKWTIPTQFLPGFRCSGICRFENTPEQQQAVKAVYRKFAAGYNLAAERSESRWDSLFEKCKPYVGDSFSFLHSGENGVDGFLSYRVESHSDGPMTATVTHLYFADPEALRSLLAFLGQLRACVRQISLTLPADVDISFWLEELCSAYDKCNVQRQITHLGASRVVDAESVLKLARYRGKGSADIRILDPVCPWNDRAFHVVFDGRCTALRETEDWDIQLDIGAFTALILGSRSLDGAAYMDAVELRGNQENLQKIFYPKPLWIGDTF